MPKTKVLNPTRKLFALGVLLVALLGVSSSDSAGRKAQAVPCCQTCEVQYCNFCPWGTECAYCESCLSVCIDCPEEYP